MSISILALKLQNLTEENKKLKKLVENTENEMKSIIKKNQEESTKVKMLLDSLAPSIEKEISENSSQTISSLLFLENIYELENKFYEIKDLIMSISALNVVITKKIERRHKKNKLLEDASKDYKERINSLVVDKVKIQEKLLNQQRIKEALVSQCVYAPSEKEPIMCRVLRI